MTAADRPGGIDTGARRSAVLAVLGAATLFGTTGTAATLAPAAAGPFSVGAARLVVGGAGLLLALPLLGGRRAAAIALWQTRWGLGAGVMTAIYQVAFFAGVARAGVALGTLVAIGCGPLLVGLISRVLLGERLTSTWWAATIVCLGGLVLLALDGAGRPEVDLVGLLLAVAASFAYALYTVAARHLVRTGHTPPDVMAAAFGLGAVLLLPVLIASGAGWLLSAPGLLVAGWLGLLTVTVAYLLFGRGLQVLPAGPVATLVLAEPLVATLLGVLVLGERPGPGGWLGAALVAAGLALQGLAASRADRVAAPGVAPAG